MITNWVLAQKTNNRQTDRQTLDRLWKEHAMRMRKHALVIDTIEKRMPNLYEQILRAVHEMDRAYQQLDLKQFQIAMQEVEGLYRKALETIR